MRREDWLDVHAYASNPEVTKYMLWGPNSEADTKAYGGADRAAASCRAKPL
ncbi:hypothetical protein ABE142_10070 [Paenibacillus alvei]|uniref:hypothetical protein n=1 Tax=Paenibacillus alvei TaxID=44250 RepID=UPI003D2C1C6B